MILIGLTGGIGSGKSTVSAGLARRGAVVVDADAITREVQMPGTAVFDAMVARFGDVIIGGDGMLDRKKVAEIVFNDDAALGDLNSIVHPAVGVELSRRVEEQAEADNMVILDVPLLVEAIVKAGGSGSASTPWGELDALIVVDTDPDLAVHRLVTHRGFTEDDARARMARQVSRQERLSMADHVVSNNGTVDDLEGEIASCWDWLVTLRDGR